MKRKEQRIRIILVVLASFFLAAGLSLCALQDNMSFFLTPAEVAALKAENSPRVAPEMLFRLGGMVREKSVKKRGQDLSVSFVVTDYTAELPVSYKGVLPDLFREGQGVVARGSLSADGVFVAMELLAKHDEKYMPPEIAKKMKAAP